MYSICYVLADNEELKYYDQMLISAYSARYRGFKGDIYVILDPHTHECILKSGRKDAAELDLKLTELAVPEELNIKEISRYLKTGCRDCVAGDMLYLDTDTLIVHELPESVSPAEIAFALDEHWPSIGGSRESGMLDSAVETKKWRIESCGYEYDPDLPYYNGGCIWSRDTEFAHLFFYEWRKEWTRCREYGMVLDQVSLFYLTSKYRPRIGELDGIWNVSVNVPQGMKYLDNAIIIHYWNTGDSVYRLSDAEIRKKGYKNEEVKEIIAHPLSAFFPSKIIRKTIPAETAFRETSTYSILLGLYSNHIGLFRCINFVISIPGKIRKMLVRKVSGKHNVGS